MKRTRCKKLGLSRVDDTKTTTVVDVVSVGSVPRKWLGGLVLFVWT